MIRTVFAALLTIIALGSSGCCHCGGWWPHWTPSWCHSGCGNYYWSEWFADPPDCNDPCDCCGNYVGHGCGCQPACGHRHGFGSGLGCGCGSDCQCGHGYGQDCGCGGGYGGGPYAGHPGGHPAGIAGGEVIYQGAAPPAPAARPDYSVQARRPNAQPATAPAAAQPAWPNAARPNSPYPVQQGSPYRVRTTQHTQPYGPARSPQSTQYPTLR